MNEMDAVRKACGPDYPMIARISVDEFLSMNGLDDGIKLEEGVKICKILAEHGIDALDVSAGIYETMNVSWEPAGYAQGWKSYLAKAVKEAVDVPVFCTATFFSNSFWICMVVGSVKVSVTETLSSFTLKVLGCFCVF